MVRVSWKPTEEGWIKINVDSATSRNLDGAATVVIARDHAGNFIHGRMTKYAAIGDTLVVETLACRDAMLLAITHGFIHVVIETDCQVVCTLWDSKDDRSICGQVFMKMRSYLHLFQGLKLQFVKREANVAAHLYEGGA